MTGMFDSQEITLEIATADDAGVLSNLVELYAHDLSEVFGVEMGPDGRFGYEKLCIGQSPGTGFPVSFAIVAGSPASRW